MATTAQRLEGLEMDVADIERLFGRRFENVEEDIGEIQEQKTDIFYQQESTIGLLYDVLQDKLKTVPTSTQPTYITQTAPKEEKEAPNYVLYIGAAAIVWLLLKGK